MDEAAAAAEIELRALQNAVEARKVEHVQRLDAVALARLLRPAGEHRDRQEGVNLPQLADNGLQNCVVAGISHAVGPDDDDTAARAAFFQPLAAQDLVVDVKLAARRRLDGKFALRLFIERFAHAAAQRGVGGEPGELFAQRGGVPGGKEEARFALNDELRHAADAGGHRREMGARALRDRIGESLRERGQSVDVERRHEGVDVRAPAREADLFFDTKTLRERAKLLHLRAVARDHETELRLLFFSEGKAADERSDVLDGVEPRRNADDDALLVALQTERAEVGETVRVLRYDGEVDAVVDRENFVGRKAARNEQRLHRVRHADEVVGLFERVVVERPVDQRRAGSGEVVELRVAVYRRHHRQAAGAFEEARDEVAARAVGVDEVVVLLADHRFELL